MENAMDYKGNKGVRLLSIYEDLKDGEMLNKLALADSYGVSPKTIQRDIEDLRAYLAEKHYQDGITVVYNKKENAYQLSRLKRSWLSNQEVMAVAKILLESRAFTKEELDVLLNKLLHQVLEKEKKQIAKMIQNEQFYYVPLKHGKALLNLIWELSLDILEHLVIKFQYQRQDGHVSWRSVKPVALMFSEYYFYLIAYKVDQEKDIPRVFRVDRIAHLERSKEHFKIPYTSKFNDGEFRKRVQFMYAGELKKVKFDFQGPSLEAMLDRLPTAEVIAEKDGVYTLKAEAYGEGILMWLASQGDWVNNVEVH